MAQPRKVRKISNRYFSELGRFVATYAKLEYFIKAIFLRILAMDEDVAMAITGGMRLVDVMPAAKRIIIAKKLDQQYYDAVEAHFQKVSDLSVFRDKIVHRQIELVSDDGVIHFQNWTSAKSKQHLETDVIGLDDLKAKTLEAAELMRGCIGLIALTEADWQEMAPYWRRLFPCPWIHKPVGPAQPPQQPRKAPRSPKRQPPA